MTLELADGSRKRIEMAEIIEHGPADAVFGEGFELEPALRTEPVDRLKEAYGRYRREVIHLYARRGTFGACG